MTQEEKNRKDGQKLITPQLTKKACKNDHSLFMFSSGGLAGHPDDMDKGFGGGAH